ncbi:hypothetical protein RDWZM_004621, partial [Blomia tropicalis]
KVVIGETGQTLVWFVANITSPKCWNVGRQEDGRTRSRREEKKTPFRAKGENVPKHHGRRHHRCR